MGIKAVITKIQENRIYAKSVNPLGEKPPKAICIVGGFELLSMDSWSSKASNLALAKWQQAESETVELQIDEDYKIINCTRSITDIAKDKYPLKSILFVKHDYRRYFIGDEINVNEQDGKFKII